MRTSTNYSVGCSRTTNSYYSIVIWTPVENALPLTVRKCEDIGHAHETHYEYYSIETHWILKETFAIYKLNEQFCDKDLTHCLSKAFEHVDIRNFCWIDRIENCSLRSVHKSKEAISHAYARQLPAGLSVYGSFRRRDEYDHQNNKTHTIALDWGLYYFSIGNS
uniref:Uncharacterized protein n=1 Tax=Caenorhabditis japonica TaxID=281687 RepID=A0A8R1E720_CAEJA